MSYKQSKIVDMFDEIAPMYDRANRLLSMGIDSKWRQDACKVVAEKLSSGKEIRVVDVACGTGDMIVEWERAMAKVGIDSYSIYGVDPSTNMINMANKKLSESIKLGRVRLGLSYASAIDVESESVDVLSISYGLRNIVDRRESLAEFYRALKPGGLLVILEFLVREGKEKIVSMPARLYTRYVLPLIGGVIFRNYKAYKYLPDSIRNFTTAKVLVEELKEDGFDNISIKDYSLGVCSLLIATKCKK